ncbi:Alpha/beta hydrolase fold-3 [Artemisia annua]|uniref:Alpha/beta hydrolase fold-3 n=1 Tax=Artemisia annua TaxID=35608 RepID=A0A2U1KW71_ARTAN|nr:Alpha/beta hydrolase fold-3 [Artemisia annua]
MDATTIKPSPTLSLPWKTRILLTIITTVSDAAVRKNGTINRRLLNFLDFRAPATPKSAKSVTSHDITLDKTRNLWFRVFIPTKHANEPLPVIMFFHGGGFVFLSPDVLAYDAVCRRFARTVPAIVVSVNYRLAPEHKYPAQHDDCFDVLKFLDDDLDMSKSMLPKNADLSRVFVVGDSAGGNLAHHVAYRACGFDFKRLKVAGVVAIQPFFGGEERTDSETRLEGTPIVSVKRTDWTWKAFLPQGEEFNRDHPIVNVSGPNAMDISKIDFPPTMVVVAGFDALHDWQKRYYEWLKKSGKEAYLFEYPNMCHAFYIFPELPEAGQLIGQVSEFIRKR